MRGCFPWCCSNERLARAPPSLCQPLHQRLLRIGPAMIILRACLEFTTGEIIVGHFCTLPSFIGNPVLKKVGAIRQKGGHAPPRENDQNLRGAAGQSWFQSIEIRKAITRKDPILSDKYLPHSQISWFTRFFAPPRPADFHTYPGLPRESLVHTFGKTFPNKAVFSPFLTLFWPSIKGKFYEVGW